MIVLLILLNHPIMEHPACPATAVATAVIDSLSYHYSLNQPDTLFMTAECSLSPDEDIKIYYSKEWGLQVKTETSFVGEIVKGLVLLTGIGICDFWKNLGEMDTVILNGDLLTLIPKEKSLFSEAELKIDKQQWLITSAKVIIEGDTVFAKISYNNRLPMEITVKGSQASLSSEFTIKHKYSRVHSYQIPAESRVIFNTDLPEIEVKYKLR